MSSIKSNTVTVDKPANEVFNFLKDLNNLEKLMPHDRIEDWQSDTDHCRFKIKGLAGIGMKLDGFVENKQIKLVSDGKNPFPFVLTIHFDGDGNKCHSFFEFDGQMNMFLKTMVEKPLKNFFNMLAEKLPSAMEE